MMCVWREREREREGGGEGEREGGWERGREGERERGYNSMSVVSCQDTSICTHSTLVEMAFGKMNPPQLVLGYLCPVHDLNPYYPLPAG